MPQPGYRDALDPSFPDTPAEVGASELPKVHVRSHRFAPSMAEVAGVEGRLAAIEEGSASMRAGQARLVARMDAMERHVEALMRTAERRGAGHLHGTDAASNTAARQSEVGSKPALKQVDEVQFGHVAPDEFAELAGKVPQAAVSEVVIQASSIRTVVPEGVPLDCKWMDSLWDAVFFIGAPWVSRSDSILMSLLLIVCGIVQVVFLGITRLIFNEPQFTDEKLDRLEQWRTNIGHNVKYYDGLSMTSLTQRVCRPDLHESEMSSGTSQLVSEMYEYIGTQEFFNGPSLVRVALLIWGLTVIHEIMHIWDVSRAVRALPRAARNSYVEVVGAKGDHLRISSLSCARYCWIILLIVWRLGTTLALWWFGNLFLCYYSIAPSEILLNALSLEIVLNIDDAMYILVPSRVKQVLNRMEPLQAPNLRFQLMKTDLRPFFFTAFMAVFIVTTEFTVLKDNASAIFAANATLCSGRQDFVYNLDPFYLVYTSETNPRNVSSAQIDALGFSQAVRETIFPETIPHVVRMDPQDPSKEVALSDPMTFEFTVNSIEEVLLRSTWGIEEAASGLQGLANQQCSDVVIFMSQIRRFIVESLDGVADNRGVTEVKSCRDIELLCSFGPIARSVCPVTCGCTSPVSSLLLSAPSHGCPAACSREESYMSVLAQLPCTEMSPTELSTDVLWGAWAAQLSAALADIFKNMPERSPCGTTCAEDFMSRGCAFIPYWKAALTNVGWHSDPCSGNYLGQWLFAKPLAAYCPITCGCNNNTRTRAELMSVGCPGQCAVGGF